MAVYILKHIFIEFIHIRIDTYLYTPTFVFYYLSHVYYT